MKSVFKLSQILFSLMIFVIFLEDASAANTCTVSSDCGACLFECREGICYKILECEDNVDNDKDGLIDGDDPGCQGAIGDVNHGKLLVANNTKNKVSTCDTYTMTEDADVLIDLRDDDCVVAIKRSEVTGSDNPYVILASTHGTIDTATGLLSYCGLNSTGTKPINLTLAKNIIGKSFSYQGTNYGNKDSAFYNRDGTLRVYYNSYNSGTTVSANANRYQTRSSRVYHLLAGDIIYMGTISDKNAVNRCPNMVMLYNKQYVESDSRGGADDPICTY